MGKAGFERAVMVSLPQGRQRRVVVDAPEPKVAPVVPVAPAAWTPPVRGPRERVRSREADVVVPAMQAAVSGVVGGALAGLVALLLAVVLDWPWYVTPAAIVSGAIVAAAWQWARSLNTGSMTLPAQQTGAEKVARLRVEYVEERAERKHWEIDDLPVSREVLARVVRRVDAGSAKWSRRGVLSTPGIGDARSRRILNDLEKFGYLHYPQGRNHPDGAVPTAKGRALFAVLADPSPRV